MLLLSILFGTLVAGVGSVWLATLVSPGASSRFAPDMLGFAAGALLSTACLHLLPEAFEGGVEAKHICIALLIGLAVEQCAAQGASWANRRIWRHYLRGLSIVALGGAVGVVVVSFWPSEKFSDARQPLPFVIAWVLVSLATTAVLIWASRSERSPRPQMAIYTAAALLGFAYVGVVVNARIRGGNDLTPAIAQIREQVPEANQLVSLGRVYHRFAYCYETPIRQVPWPLAASDLPADVTYFCFDHRPSDTAQWRSTNDGSPSPSTPGTLPFEWDKIAEIPADPVKRGEAHRTVIIGRVHKLDTAARPGASPPALR